MTRINGLVDADDEVDLELDLRSHMWNLSHAAITNQTFRRNRTRSIDSLMRYEHRTYKYLSRYICYMYELYFSSATLYFGSLVLSLCLSYIILLLFPLMKKKVSTQVCKCVICGVLHSPRWNTDVSACISVTFYVAKLFFESNEK